MDFVAAGPGVRAWDLRRGVPYPDESFDVVYHSHVLEHFPRKDGEAFLIECRRVLKPGGILRVAVPDLEQIAREYLKALENARQGRPGSAANYDWMMLELYDQTVRERTGGELVEFLQRQPENIDFIRRRIGSEASVHESPGQKSGDAAISKWRYVAENFGSVAKNKMARLILGDDDYARLMAGRFRREGEVHQWMYDSYSLGRLLQKTGFAQIQAVTATNSAIPNWNTFGLDASADGTVHKPDSLFMEALKS